MSQKSSRSGEDDLIIVVSADQLRRVLAEELQAFFKSNELVSGASSPAEALKEWLTDREAQAYTGMSKSTLARFRAAGKLRYSKTGNNLRYRKHDLDVLLDRGRSP